MEFKTHALKGIVEITPRILEDRRGLFFESYNENTFKKNGLDLTFVQDNHSFSYKNVLRGLHFQKPPFEQGKLVRVIKGKVLDVVVDIRPKSPTFGEHLKVELDEKRGNMLWIPAGFAHGFLTLEDTIFVYKCTNFYNKASEDGIIWNDDALQIDWGIENPITSDKDLEYKPFTENKGAFKDFIYV
jgi:dTDP-4-dehydrorhamnose 3,5-epimerase